MWDSRCFNYGSREVLRFLALQSQVLMEEFGFDGFRFHGDSKEMYSHQCLVMASTGDYYGEYFYMSTDVCYGLSHAG